MPKSTRVGSKKKRKGPVLVGSKSSSPKPPSKPKAQELVRGDAALRRLFKDTVHQPEDLGLVPQITDSLKNCFKNIKAAIDLLRFSNETAAIEFLRVYDVVPAGDRKYLSIEAICLKAAVSPAALFGATFMACKTVRGQESALMAVNAHPDVLKATIQWAKLPGGDRHARMIHEAVGFLPTPKGGGNINVNLLGGNPVHGNPDRVESAPAELSNEDFGDLFPSINSNLERWSDSRRKLLEAGKPSTLNG